MQLSSKTQHACLAVLELSLRFEESAPISLRTIAESHNISSQFLVQILLQLKRARIVESTRGANGGYRLALPPDQISLLDVVEAVEGTTATPRFDSDNPSARALFEAWSEISEAQQQRLAETSFEQLAASVQSGAPDMYYI